MKASEIRQSFMDFFEARQHEIVPSSPVVLPSDPTLLFTNAGMNQFKEVFLGAREATAKRVADTQKCIRVSGKHNDLEEVGHDTYHHTFFEMLGNWSFGDYYKREAITWAWELLTDTWKLPKDRLYATVYLEDDEAEALWKECTDIDPSHIMRFGEKDNFWEMGETGPCGPCSEVHIDITKDGTGKALVNAGSPEVIEIWNLVFIQYMRKSDGSLEELPAKHVDTGMGLERVVSVIQGKSSNYDTDLFQPIIRKIEAMSGCAYEGDAAIAMRVVADHLRALSFAVADGVMPSNEGRGYVLRRLLRRAVRYGRKLGLTDPFMKELFPVLEAMMAPVFPELTERRDTVIRALHAEEESFSQTLDRGLTLFDEVVHAMEKNGTTVFPGDEAFKLYDTFGFPIDLTELMAAEKSLSVDKATFDVLMQEQRSRARKARKAEGIGAEMDQIGELVSKGVRSTFTGYDTLNDEGEILALFADGQMRETLAEGAEAQLLLSRTPFYAESGGQVGDQGVITTGQAEFIVTDTRKPADGILLHIGKVVRGTFTRGETVKADVDAVRRSHIQRHHTATHLLNFGLRTLVNASIKQAGSFVGPDYLRFDFGHYEAVPREKLSEIEQEVNERILRNVPVKTYSMALKDVPGSGIVAVFDEKYGDEVRVLDIGSYSKELCGGTHVHATGDIGLFRIVSESSVASGVRRIEAVCGVPALAWTRQEHELVQELSQRFSVTPAEIPQRVDTLVAQNRKLEKALKQQQADAALEGIDALLKELQNVNGIPLIAVAIGEHSADNLRTAMDALRPKLKSGVIVLGSTSGDKVCLMASSTDDCIQKGIHAGKLVGRMAKITGGGGGGQPHKAQAGGKQPDKLPEAMAAAPEIVTDLLLY
ncbi:MAG: alanine--tRNA ligase [Spartobacteria bacterium]|nr:alanine--tRNA ligase [Spartobacteria bacterium]